MLRAQLKIREENCIRESRFVNIFATIKCRQRVNVDVCVCVCMCVCVCAFVKSR